MATEVSNPDRVIFPDTGFTKREVVDYYELVADLMLPHITGSPLTLHRFPKGIAEKGFMQKNAGDHFPDTIGRVEVPKRGGTTRFPVVTEAADVPYLANQGTITFHVWTSRLPNLYRPDRIVFDLDPPAGSVSQVREAAWIVKEHLDALGMESAPMTTGSKGFHIVIAITPTPYEAVGRFSRASAELLARAHRDLLTTEFRIENRKGRVFIDWLRNRPGATGVAAWSLRARPEAPVAVPIEWPELEEVAPDHWRLDTISERFAAGDSLATAYHSPQETGAAIAAIDAAAEGLDLEPFDRFR